MSRKIHNDTQIFYAKEDKPIHILPDDIVDCGQMAAGEMIAVASRVESLVKRAESYYSLFFA